MINEGENRRISTHVLIIKDVEAHKIAIFPVHELQAYKAYRFAYERKLISNEVGLDRWNRYVWLWCGSRKLTYAAIDLQIRIDLISWFGWD